MKGGCSPLDGLRTRISWVAIGGAFLSACGEPVVETTNPQDREPTALDGAEIPSSEGRKPPEFDGVVSAKPISEEQVDLAWNPASDNATPPESIVYEICWSGELGGCSRFSTSATTASGASGYSVKGLQSGTRYSFVVRAIDEQGNRDHNTREMIAVTQLPIRAQQIALGGQHVCALVPEGAVKCWGSNEHGQVGYGSVSLSAEPIKVEGLEAVSQIVAGTAHTCVLLTDGRVKCWGKNSDGQVGDGTTIDRPAPVEVISITGARSVVAGYNHSCALLSDGKVMCWGNNVPSGSNVGPGLGPETCVSQGQTMSCATKPVAVPHNGVIRSVALGNSDTCILPTGGDIQCWGSTYVSFGNGVAGAYTSKLAVTMTNLAGAGTISFGNGHACALFPEGGRVRCWGNNNYGQLGIGTNSGPQVCGTAPYSAGCSSSPVAVTDLSEVVSLAAGDFSHCALVPGGRVKCWGLNDQGELGDGTTVTRFTPTEVSGLSNVAEIVGSKGHSICALLEKGEMKCWGSLFGTTPTTPYYPPGTLADPPK